MSPKTRHRKRAAPPQQLNKVPVIRGNEVALQAPGHAASEGFRQLVLDREGRIGFFRKSKAPLAVNY